MTGKGVQKEFKRYAYTISDRASNLTLIHYKGDDSIVNENPHVRTCGSVLRELENSTQSPSVVYKKNIVDCSSTMLSPVLLPRVQRSPVLLPSIATRNRKQVSNCQHLRRQAFRLSHDALYNLHELLYDIPDFVHKIVTFPDLIVVCGIKRFLMECNRLLALHSTLPSSQLLSYDTTFQLGDFYLSPLLFRNTLFQKSPVMPVMFAIHERKLKSTRTEMMKIVAQELPFLASNSTKKLVPLVTDDEKGFLKLLNSTYLISADFSVGTMQLMPLNSGCVSMVLQPVKFRCMLVIFGICFTRKQKWNTVNGWKS